MTYQMMSGKLPYEVPIQLMKKEIKSKERPHVQGFSKKLNDLVDKMLTIDVSQRITVEGILITLDETDYFIEQVLEAEKQGLNYVKREDLGDGAFYSGYLLEGKRHGHGTYTFADGSKYKGGWKLGEQHGKGKG